MEGWKGVWMGVWMEDEVHSLPKGGDEGVKRGDEGGMKGIGSMEGVA